MQFIIKQITTNNLSGDIRVMAGDAKEALDIVRSMIERGAIEVQISDMQDNRYDISHLEGLAREVTAQTDASI